MSVSSIPNLVNYPTRRTDNKQSIVAQFVTNNVNDFKSGDLWRASVAEFVGTLLLVFYAVAVGMRHEDQEPVPLLQIALGVGFIVGVIITSLTTVSGGHINPAISMGFLIAKDITLVRFVVYTIFQTLGAVAAVALIQAIMPSSYHGNLGLLLPGRDVGDGIALVVEMIISGTLIFVTLAMVDKYRTDVAGSVPFLVGLTVCVIILATGNVSGGCMNPARATGSAILIKSMDRQWVYWVGPLVGAAVASWLYTNIFSTRPLAIVGKCIHREERTYNKTEDETDLNLNDIVQ